VVTDSQSNTPSISIIPLLATGPPAGPVCGVFVPSRSQGRVRLQRACVRRDDLRPLLLPSIREESYFSFCFPCSQSHRCFCFVFIQPSRRVINFGVSAV
jgi:hypothetical protein